MQTEYERLILGATFAGIGAAVRRPEGCLIVERRTQPGYEYIDSFSTVRCNGTALGAEAQALEQQLRGRGILSEDGKVAHGALAAFLNGYLLEQNVSILLQTEVVAVTACDGYYAVDLVNASGKRCVTAKEVFYAQPPMADGDVYMSAQLVSSKAGMEPLQAWQENMALEPGYFDGQMILKVRVDANATMQQARAVLMDCWRARPAQYAGWRIAVFAEELDVFYGRAHAVDFLTAFDRAEQRLLARTEKRMDGYDLIVVGMGTTGTIAAITAARMGLSVLGIERLSNVGGTSTAGVVLGYYFGSTGGVYEQLDAQMATALETDFGFRTPAREAVWEQAAVDAGVTLLYHAAVVDVKEENGRVTGVCVVTDHEYCTAQGRYVLDCTGDGEVCVQAGCAYTVGRTADRQVQPYTRMETGIADGSVYGSANVDFGRVDVDCAADLTYHLLWSGAQFAKQHISPQDKEYSICLSPMLGIREGRLIACEQRMTAEDLFGEYKEEQPLFYAYADLDKHGWDLAFEEDMLCDWAVGANLGAVNASAAVPLGAMIPKEKQGLLVAGRCMGMDHVMASCVRMQRDMQKAGEAIATAVSLAVHKNIPVQAVPYDELSALLKKSGCLDKDNDAGFVFDAPPRCDIPPRPIVWMTKADQIREGLSGNCPGVAIWSCKRLGRAEMEPALNGWLHCGNENLRKHSAIALALLDSSAGEEVLLEMLRERDGFVLQDCRKHNQIRGVIAIYALRRLKSQKAVPELCAIAAGGSAEFAHPVYHMGIQNTRYQVAEYNDTYFQFLSHAVCALLVISKAHSQEREAVDRALTALLADDYVARIVPGLSSGCEYQMAKNLAAVVRREQNRQSH